MKQIVSGRLLSKNADNEFRNKTTFTVHSTQTIQQLTEYWVPRADSAMYVDSPRVKRPHLSCTFIKQTHITRIMPEPTQF